MENLHLVSHFSNINIIVKLVTFMCTVYNPESNSFLRGIEFNKNCWKQSIYVCSFLRILEIISFISYVRDIGSFFLMNFFFLLCLMKESGKLECAMMESFIWREKAKYNKYGLIRLRIFLVEL